jgi:hypothetical protein
MSATACMFILIPSLVFLTAESASPSSTHAPTVKRVASTTPATPNSAAAAAAGSLWEVLRAPVWYCDTRCQTADYPSHKHVCGKVSSF